MDHALSDLPKLPRMTFSVAPQEPLIPPLPPARLRDLIYSCQVRARGWYFPLVKPDEFITGPNASYVGHEIDDRRWDHLERWRLYASGQFLFEEMLWDVPDIDFQATMRKNSLLCGSGERNEVVGFVNFISLIYRMSEAFTFAANLVQAAPYKSQVNIHTELRGVKDWALGSADLEAPISPYTARAEKLLTRKSFGLDELVADPLHLASSSIIELFQQFGFLEPPERMIDTWQSTIFRERKRA